MRQRFITRPLLPSGAAESPCGSSLNVDDLADACLYLMDHYDGDDFFNVGYGKEVTIRELAELVKKVTGYEGESSWDPTKPHGTRGS